MPSTSRTPPPSLPADGFRSVGRDVHLENDPDGPFVLPGRLLVEEHQEGGAAALGARASS